jgi:hypothetical protein
VRPVEEIDMKPKALQIAMSALTAIGLLGGTALSGSSPLFAQDGPGEYGDPPENSTNNVWPDPNRPNQPPPLWRLPGPGIVVPAPVFPGPGYYDRYYDPGYVQPAPRSYHRRYARSMAERHIDWCYDQYRSYREWDNSWKPLRGPRRECVSPFYY